MTRRPLSSAPASRRPTWRWSRHQFDAEVNRAVIYKISHELLLKLVYEETGKLPKCDICNDMFHKFITHQAGIDYSIRMTLQKPS